MSDDIVELVSSLPLDVCCRVMAGQIESRWTWSRSRPLVGEMKGTWLRVCRRINYRNSFQTCLTATLSAHGGGTLVRCSFAMHPFVKAFMVVWFTFVVGLGGVVAASSLIVSRGSPPPKEGWFGVIQPLVMLGFGIALVRIGRYLARNERDILLAFVCDTLQAAPRS